MATTLLFYQGKEKQQIGNGEGMLVKTVKFLFYFFLLHFIYLSCVGKSEDLQEAVLPSTVEGLEVNSRHH